MAATAAPYCAALPVLQKKVEDCEDNDAFIQAGEQCLERLEKDVAAEAKALGKSFVAPEGGKQAASQGSSFSDYNLSSEKLALLIAHARQAILEVQAFKQSLVLPEDSDEPEVTGGNRERYIQSVECYGDSRDSLTDIGEDLKDELAQLEAAKRVADAHAATSEGRKAGLDSGSEPGMKAVQGRGTGGMKAGKSGRHQSDVTGAEESLKKEKKK